MAILIGTASCGTIQKRNYNKGYAINWRQGSRSEAIEVTNFKTKKEEKGELKLTEKSNKLAACELSEIENKNNLSNLNLSYVNNKTFRSSHKNNYLIENKNTFHNFHFNNAPQIDSTKKTSDHTIPDAPNKDGLSDGAFWLILALVFLAIAAIILSLIPFYDIALGIVISILISAIVVTLIAVLLGRIDLDKLSRSSRVYRRKARGNASRRGAARASIHKINIILAILALLATLGIIYFVVQYY